MKPERRREREELRSIGSYPAVCLPEGLVNTDLGALNIQKDDEGKPVSVVAGALFDNDPAIVVMDSRQEKNQLGLARAVIEARTEVAVAEKFLELSPPEDAIAALTKDLKDKHQALAEAETEFRASQVGVTAVAISRQRDGRFQLVLTDADWQGQPRISIDVQSFGWPKELGAAEIYSILGRRPSSKGLLEVYFDNRAQRMTFVAVTGSGQWFSTLRLVLVEPKSHCLAYYLEVRADGVLTGDLTNLRTLEKTRVFGPPVEQTAGREPFNGIDGLKQPDTLTDEVEAVPYAEPVGIEEEAEVAARAAAVAEPLADPEKDKRRTRRAASAKAAGKGRGKK